MSCCKKCLSLVPDSVIYFCLKLYKIWLIVFNIGMIFFEALDKYVDIATAVEYHKGNLFYKPKESVYTALLVFTIIGCIISATKILLSGWRIYLNCTGNKSYDERYDGFNLGTQSAKVMLEAFPQSVIAKFYFVHCPIKKYGWGIRVLDPAFDGFCGLPFLVFLGYLFHYGCKNILGIKCCEKTDIYQNIGQREWLKNFWTCCTTLFCSCFGSVLFITVAMSVIGLVLASLSISEFAKRCS